MKALIKYSERLTTFLAQSYQHPDLCLQFQWGQM
jgi:hypothetical protein